MIETNILSVRTHHQSVEKFNQSKIWIQVDLDKYDRNEREKHSK